MRHLACGQQHRLCLLRFKCQMGHQTRSSQCLVWSLDLVHIFVAQELDSWSILQCRQCIEMNQSRKGDDLQIGNIEVINIIGPRINPCGTPNHMFTDSDVRSSICTKCDRSLKQQFNQHRNYFEKPSMDNLVIRILQLTVSNALEKSASTMRVTSPFFIARSAIRHAYPLALYWSSVPYESQKLYR